MSYNFVRPPFNLEDVLTTLSYPGRDVTGAARPGAAVLALNGRSRAQLDFGLQLLGRIPSGLRLRKRIG